MWRLLDCSHIAAALRLILTFGEDSAQILLFCSRFTQYLADRVGITYPIACMPMQI